MGRAAGIFQDRLVTELRLASAVTIQEANEALREFLPRFNARFGVSPELPEAANRPGNSGVNVARFLALSTPVGWTGTTY